MSEPTTSTSLIFSITYSSECSITIWPGLRTSYNTTGKPWYLMSSELAFLHPPISYHSGKAYRQILQWSGKEMQKFRKIIYPAWVAALHNRLFLSPSGLSGSIDLCWVTGLQESSGTIPDRHNWDSQLSGGLFRGIPCNEGHFYHLADIQGHRQHRPCTHERHKDATEGQTCHWVWRKNRMQRNSFPHPNGTPKGRGQTAPTGSLQFKGTVTYQLQLRQHSPHAALSEISSVLWTLS